MICKEKFFKLIANDIFWLNILPVVLALIFVFKSKVDAMTYVIGGIGLISLYVAIRTVIKTIK